MDSSAWIIAKKRDCGNGDQAAAVNFEIPISTALQCIDQSIRVYDEPFLTVSRKTVETVWGSALYGNHLAEAGR
jgi:hypothetical protein